MTWAACRCWIIFARSSLRSLSSSSVRIPDFLAHSPDDFRPLPFYLYNVWSNIVRCAAASTRADAASTEELLLFNKERFLPDLTVPVPTDPLSILKTVYGYDAFRGQQRE